MFKNKPYDVIVLGGGLTGLTQSILLAQNGLKVLCLDKKDPKAEKNSPFYQRTTAISYASSQLLKATDVWKDIQKHACPIQTIDVKDGASSSLLTLHHDAEKSDAFGWVVQNGLLIETLTKALKKQKNATYITHFEVQNIDQNDDEVIITDTKDKTYNAQLLIGADGRQSYVRTHLNIEAEEFLYDQNAVVAIITHTNDHYNQAVEHFRQSGPFAILPMTPLKKGHYRSSIVWTEETKTKTSLMDMNDEIFLTAIREQIPSTYGDILKIESRFSYPLGYIHAHDYIGKRTVLIGDAAHGIHPIAGQGLNLGLRDVAVLTELLIENKMIDQDLGSNSILKQYQKLRRADNTIMAVETDQINRIFASSKLVTKIARKIGLKTIDNIDGLKEKLTRQMMGLSGNIPRLIKEGKI